MGKATENDFNNAFKEVMDVVRLMPIIKFLKDFYISNYVYYGDHCYEIHFVSYMEPVDECISIGGITLGIFYKGISYKGYIDILGLTHEEQEVLKRELPQYRFH